MQNNKIQILSTRPVDQTLIDEAAACNIYIDVVSFIETEPILNEDLNTRIAALSHQPITAVFTSMNAVDAVTNTLDNSPRWTVGSIGTTTRRLVEQKLKDASIIATGNNASELAHNLAEVTHTRKVVFFCGDQRRDELPAILKEQGIEVEELVVYKTIPQAVRIIKQYDGIAFFSPSAVAGFFSINQLNSSTIVFAIGETTSTEVKKNCNNKVVVSPQPGKDNLIKNIIDYYTSTPQPVNRKLL
jgi:uroporphyrinogen-III synthase